MADANRGPREVKEEDFVLSLETGNGSNSTVSETGEDVPPPPVRPREIPRAEFVSQADAGELEESEVDESFLQKIAAALENGRDRGAMALEKSGGPAKWVLLFGIVGILLASLITSAVTTIKAYFELSTLWGLLASGFWAIGGAAAAFLVLREIVAYAKLKKFEALRELTQKAGTQPELNSVERYRFFTEMSRFCDHLADYPTSVDKEGLASVRQRIEDRAEPAELCTLASQKVLKALDEKVYTVVTGEAFLVAGVVSLSPFAVLDGVIVAVRGLRMVRRIAEIYHVRPGLMGTIRLLRKVFGAALYANLTQIAMSAFSGKLAGKALQAVGVATAQGLTTGALFLWVGLAVHREIRPVPFDDKYHQAGVLRTLWVGLREMLKRGKEK